ncbi:MAG: DUF1080 domain-containing protein [Planctomycetota bacterium]
MPRMPLNSATCFSQVLFGLATLLMLGGVLMLGVDARADIPAGFTAIFDGKSLDGWHGEKTMNPRVLEAKPDAERQQLLAQWAEQTQAHWRVKDGEIINDGKGPFLVTDRDYEDYELYLEYRTVPLADSGIYLKDTPQVQIWDVTNVGQFKQQNYFGSGGLWNNSAGAPGKNPLVLADKPLGQWNTVKIRQVGARTTVVLNGQLVVDHAIMENYWDRKSPLFRKGGIQLQTHGGEIRWRHLAIRELSTDEANEVLDQHEKVAYRPLFNGEDLQGWTGDRDSYEVVEGAIRCKAGQGGNLLTEKEYSNFAIRLEFQLPPGGNNGLAIRAPLKGNPAYQAMTELQVLDTEHPKYKNIDPRQAHGSAYGMVAAKRGYLRPTGQWNFQQVEVVGSKVYVELNGYPILDADLAEVTDYMADSPHPGKDRASGHFGFAGHNDPVSFRNIQVRMLPATPK